MTQGPGSSQHGGRRVAPGGVASAARGERSWRPDGGKVSVVSQVRYYCIQACIQAWAPYYVTDLLLLEKVKRRVTKLVCGLRDLS